MEILVNNVTTRTSTTRGGDVIERSTGALRVLFSTVDPVTGEETSIVRNISGPVVLTVHPDGSADQVAAGPSFTFLDEAIAEADGLPRAIITYGRVVTSFETFDLATDIGTGFAIESLAGRYEDVCAALD